MQAWTGLGAYSAFAASLMSLILVGCGRTDSEYRPIDKAAFVSETGERTDVSKNGAPARDTNIPAPETVTAEDGAKPDVTADTATAAMEPDIPASALAPVNVVDGASVAMLLKVAPADAATAKNAAPPESPQPESPPPTPDTPRKAQLLIPEKRFQRDAASKAWRVSYDDLDLLKVLNLEPVSENAVELMPDWLTDLNGQRIKIRGFMYPTFEAEGIERFVLARDNQICCFGRDPKVYDLVQVDMRSGKTTSYIPATRSFDVVGRFKIEMASEDGKPYGLYYLEDAEIIDR